MRAIGFAGNCRRRAVQFIVALVSAVCGAAMVSDSVEANGTWRYPASQCTLDNIYNPVEVDGSAQVANYDASTSTNAWCALPFFYDTDVGVGTISPCDVDIVEINVYDGNNDANKGVSFTLIEHEVNLNSASACTTISTNDGGANWTGTATLRYDEVDGGSREADIDDCTQDSDLYDLSAYVNIPDSDGAGAGDSRIIGRLRLVDNDNDAGCVNNL